MYVDEHIHGRHDTNGVVLGKQILRKLVDLTSCLDRVKSFILNVRSLVCSSKVLRWMLGLYVLVEVEYDNGYIRAPSSCLSSTHGLAMLAKRSVFEEMFDYRLENMFRISDTMTSLKSVLEY